MLRTENAEDLGDVLERRDQEPAQAGRDPYELARLAPGVFGLGARDGAGNSVGVPNQQGPGGSNSSVFGTENQVPISANGQRVEANNFQLDGVTAMSQAWGGAAVVTPNQESVKEIRVISSSYSAENGRNTGAQVQVVSQNGTNDFHGSLVFKRNTPGLNSYQSDDWVGPAGELPERVNRRLSQTAGSVGGPIFRNKLFFFFSFEASNSKRQLPAVTEWVETPELVNAIKSQRPNSTAAQFLNYPGMTPPNIARVLNAVDVGSLAGSQGETIADPLGGGLDGVPDLQQVQLEGFENQTARQFNGRIDYSVTAADLVAFSTYFVPVDTNSLDPAVWGNTARPVGDFTSERRNMVGTLLWSRTIGSTMLNEARFNVTRWYFDEIASNPEQPWGLPRLWVNQPVGTENPLVSYGPGIGPGVFYQTTYNFRDTLTKVINTHALKIGGDVIFEQNNDKAPWAGTPEYHFNSLWNFANDAPFDEVAFFDPTDGAFTDLASYARTNYYALYVQDDWKARAEPHGQRRLALGVLLAAAEQERPDLEPILGANGGLVDATLQSGGDLYEKDQNNFGPQVGAAWTPQAFGGRAVVRGGFGVSYNRLPGSRLLESRFNPPFFAGFTLTGSDVAYRTASDPTRLRLPEQPGGGTDVRSGDRAAVERPAGQRQRDRAGAAEPVHLPLLGRQRLRDRPRLGGLCRLPGEPGQQPRAPRSLPAVRPEKPAAREREHAADRRGQPVQRAAHAADAPLCGRLHVQRRVPASARAPTPVRAIQNCRQTYPFDQTTEEGPSDFDVRHSFKLFGTWDLPISATAATWSASCSAAGN